MLNQEECSSDKRPLRPVITGCETEPAPVTGTDLAALEAQIIVRMHGAAFPAARFDTQEW